MTRPAVRNAISVAVSAVVLLPIYWMLATSLKSNKEITQDATLYPHLPTFENYVHLFSRKQFDAAEDVRAGRM